MMRSVAVGDTGRRALVFGTRTHFYEGRGVRAVVHGVRTAAAAGCSTLVLTNGCGGLRPEWAPGTPVLISDHINLTGASPLEGATFVDLTDLYTARLRALAHAVDPTLDEGVYVQFRGPQYETPAEVQMARTLGGRPRRHVDGARSHRRPARRARRPRHLARDQSRGGDLPHPAHHEEVLDAGRAAAERCGRLLADIVPAI